MASAFLPHLGHRSAFRHCLAARILHSSIMEHTFTAISLSRPCDGYQRPCSRSRAPAQCYDDDTWQEKRQRRGNWDDQCSGQPNPWIVIGDTIDHCEVGVRGYVKGLRMVARDSLLTQVRLERAETKHSSFGNRIWVRGTLPPAAVLSSHAGFGQTHFSKQAHCGVTLHSLLWAWSVGWSVTEERWDYF